MVLASFAALACGSDDSSKAAAGGGGTTGDGGPQGGSAGTPSGGTAGGGTAGGGTGGAGATAGTGAAGSGGAGAGGVGGTGGTGGASVEAVTVEPLYPGNGALWMDWVDNDGSDALSASDAACDSSTAGVGCGGCLHGGEHRVAVVTSLSDCTDVTASDSLGAFDWVCDDSGSNVRIISTGLAASVNLADLLDFTGGAFLDNALEINRAGQLVASSMPAVWWGNPVEIDVDGFGSDQPVATTIYLVNADTDAEYFWSGVDQVAIVVASGFSLTETSGATSVVAGQASNFHWFEGAVDGTGRTRSLTYSGTECVTVNNGSLSNATGPNLFLNVCASCRVLGTTAADGGNEGVDVRDSPGVLMEDVSATGNGGDGISSSRSLLSTVRVSAQGNGGHGFFADQCDGCQLRLIDSTGSGAQGMRLTNTTGLIVDGVTVDGADGEGMVISGVADGVFSDLNISNVGSASVALPGLRIINGTNNELRNARVSNAGDEGVLVESGGAENMRFYDIQVVGNAGRGFSLSAGQGYTVVNLVAADNADDGVFTQTANTHLSQVRAFNNADNGVDLRGTRVTLAGLFTFSNSGSGVAQNSCESCVIMNASAVNNGGGTSADQHGFAHSGAGTNHVWANLLASNNVGVGFGVLGGANTQPNVASNIVVTHSGLAGVDLQGSSDVRFTGALKLGVNAEACDVDGSASGLVDVSCANEGSSDAVLSSSADTTDSFVGKVAADDTANPDDTSGSASYDAIVDFTSFDAPERGWGQDFDPFPAQNHRSACSSGETCRIWDFGLLSTDTDALDVIAALVTGDDSVTLPWTVTGGVTNQADCDAAMAGSTFVTDHCESTFLLGAVEIADDGIGNDNNLCESAETCLFSPNAGGYQGHGTLESAGSFTDGAVSGVTLMRFPTNGR